MPNTLASTVAGLFFNGWICRYGAPAALHTDQGSQFESRLFQSLCTILDITKTRTTPYHPQSDGMVERFNRTLEAMIATSISDHRDWGLHLQPTALAYRTSVHASTGYSPFRLQFGYDPVLPLDVMYGLPRNTPPPSYPEFGSSIRTSTETAFERARQHGLKSHQHQKKGYDGTSRPPPKFTKDQLVLLHSPVVPQHESPTFHRFWTGPYVIQKVIDDVTVRIRSLSDRQRLSIVHVNRLKPYHQVTDVRPATPLTYDPEIHTTPAHPPLPQLQPPAPPPPAPPYNLRPRQNIHPPAYF